ncbi:MAG: hypothetical protein VB022_05360 [Rikenellaceae bacterium]|nr:hypothetical protein [Rikenellaceae bacterium]
MYAEYPELQELLKQIELRYGSRVKTSVDFECLSEDITFNTKQIISSSTLKRIWGYVDYKFLPRESTLDVLAKYIGQKSYSDFCKSIPNQGCSTSSFISDCRVMSEDLEKGNIVKVSWSPNRIVCFKYNGNHNFSVLESINSKIHAGDSCNISSFTKGHPLYLTNIASGSERYRLFIAGKEEGLTDLKIVK